MVHPLTRVLTILFVTLIALAVSTPPAAAEMRTSSDLLLPYFEIGLDGSRTTLFAVGNGKAEPVRVQASIATNWGIRVLQVTLDLDAGQVATYDLRSWIGDGRLPTLSLGPDMLAHVQAALTGQASPRDGMYYGSEVEPGLAVGFVTFKVLGSPRPDSLWGDYFWIDANGDLAEGESLIDMQGVHNGSAFCDRHLVRFLQGGGFDAGTELVVWMGRRGTPQAEPSAAFVHPEIGGGAFYREDGAKFDERLLHFGPTQVIPLAGLDLAEDFGWIDLVTENPVYVGVRFSALDRFAVALQSWCQEEPPEAPEFLAVPAIDLEKRTNGLDADSPPGPALQIGSVATWEYVVTNTGNVPLSDIVVSDNRGVVVTCPSASLRAGQSMTCTGSGVVTSGPYSNVGTVVGSPPSGPSVSDSDASHHTGVHFLPGGNAAIDVEKLTNGLQADAAPGPTLEEGALVTWTYIVTNVGGSALVNVTVEDSDPAVTVVCPASELGLAETMICSAGGVAEVGQYQNTATATGEDGGITVSDTDDSHYFGTTEPPPVDAPAIRIEKLTNGFDADGVGSAPQLTHGDDVTWTYVVTNTGNVALGSITVSDDKGVAVSCPGTTLGAGEQMVCTGSGTAVGSDECYCNVGLVVASPPEGDDVTDSDPSHYCAAPIPPGIPKISIEKSTNGEDADVAPGPTLTVGDNVQWSYVVENVGDVPLIGVTVVDDQGVVITCAGGQPFSLGVGATKTCLGNGTAELGQYANVATATGTPEGGGADVSDTDPSHYFGEEEPGEVECRVCSDDNPDSGKVNSLLMEYTGAASDVLVEVFLSNGADCGENGLQVGAQVFSDTLDPGDTFLLAQDPSLGTNIVFFVGGVCNTRIHTSCSVWIFPGYSSGDFEVVEGSTLSGEGEAPLCPLVD